MAITPHFFNKRDAETATERQVVPLQQVLSKSHLGSPLKATGAGRSNLNRHGLGTHINHSAAVSLPVIDNGAPVNVGSKLSVGPSIKLKGVEITDCDTLVVEGLVEASIDARRMEIAEQGAFKGSAEVDLAEIRGQFEGELTVRQKLVIHDSGRVNGKIRYGQLVVQEGGQITGDIQFGTQGQTRATAVEMPHLAVAN